MVQYRIKRYKASLFYNTSTCRINISVFNVAPKEYRVFSRDVTAGVLVFLNKGTAAMLVSPTNSPGIELYSNAKVFFFFVKKKQKKTRSLITWVKTFHRLREKHVNRSAFQNKRMPFDNWLSGEKRSRDFRKTGPCNGLAFRLNHQVWTYCQFVRIFGSEPIGTGIVLWEQFVLSRFRYEGVTCIFWNRTLVGPFMPKNLSR